MVFWPSGHLDFWPSSLLAIWSSGHLTIWSSGLLVIWSSRLLAIWSSGHPTIRSSGYLVIQTSGQCHLIIRSSDHLVIRPFGHRTIRSSGLLSRCLKNVLIGIFFAYLFVSYTNLKFLTSSLVVAIVGMLKNEEYNAATQKSKYGNDKSQVNLWLFFVL